MKILYLIHSLTVGGAEMLVVNYLLQLKSLGHDVSLIQMRDEKTFLNQRLEQADIPVQTVRKSNKTNVLSKLQEIYTLRRLIQSEKPDVLHVHTGLEKMGYVSFPVKQTAFTVHSSWERCLAQGKNHQKQLLRMIQNGMTVIVLSQKAKEEVSQQFPDAKVALIPNGMDLEQIRKKRYEKSSFLHSLGIEEDAFIVGHVGRFHPVKNHEKLIRVFAEVTKQKSNAYLFLVGDGNPEQEKKIDELLQKYEVEEKTIRFGARQDATEIMSTMDCLVLTSFSESFSLVLVEAQALGVRCVASAGVPQEVCCNENCIRLDLDEPDVKWADYVLGDQQHEKQFDLERYQMERVIQEHVDLYNALIS